MSATGPFADILSERAALLAVVDGAVTTLVAEEEPDDGLGLEEVMVPGRVPVEVPEVTESVGDETGETLDTVVLEAVATVVLEAVTTVVLEPATTVVLEAVVTDVLEAVENVMGPGPRLKHRISKRNSNIVNETNWPVTYDILLCARTLPATMATIKKTWGTEKRINGAQRRVVWSCT